jgi:DNA-binding NarL/FixJ family response regulator
LLHILLSGNCFPDKESVINLVIDFTLHGGALAKSILIIDDDRNFRNALEHVFECREYNAYEACNGKEGIEFYRRISTDIVLTDIFMPEKDGMETMREIKKNSPTQKLLRCLAKIKAIWIFSGCQILWRDGLHQEAI